MNAIAQYIDLYDQILMDVPAATKPEMLVKCQLVGRRFCIDTEALQEILIMDLVDGQTTYTLAPILTGGEVRRIELIEPETHSRGYHLGQDFQLILRSAPTSTVAGGLKVKAIEIPKPPACELPDWFLCRWFEPIVAGVKAALLSPPGHDWTTDPGYQAGVLEASRDKLTGGKRQSLRMNMGDWY